MKKTFLFLISALIGFALIAGPATSPVMAAGTEKAGKELKLAGTIEGYNNMDSTLILKLHNKKMDTLQLTATTMVEQKGKAVPFTELTTGERATVFYMKENGRNMAVRIELWPSKTKKMHDTGMRK